MSQPVINYLAVLVAALASMAIGMLWYGPLFGNMWKKLMNFTDRDMKKMNMTAAQAMIFGFISTLVLSFVLAHFVDYLNAITFRAALQVAFWIWLGFIATVMLGMVLWEGKPWKLYFLNAAYQLVSLAVMAVILALWA
ncbi:DUF1761 domain-containing protein [Candidatus Woesearchaeota archaeon]|nr:DUF1761 domain-containing protein [Candidatus Woesearchaeota archaeon]